MRSEYGQREYLSTLARKQEDRKERMSEAQADRRIIDEKTKAFQNEAIRRKEQEIKQK